MNEGKNVQVRRRMPTLLRQLFPRKIKTKITMLVMAVCVFVLALSFLGVSLGEALRTRTELLSKQSALADTIAFNVAPAVIFDDPVAAGKTLASLQADPQINNAYLVTRTTGCSPALPERKSPRIPVSDRRPTSGRPSTRYAVNPRLCGDREVTWKWSGPS